MKKSQALYTTIVSLSWGIVSYYIYRKFFDSDFIFELISFVCFSSIGIFISFGTVYYLEKIKGRQ